jgi:hypothetical protein
MSKKTDSLIVNIQRQQEQIEVEQEKLLEMIANLNEERLTTITKTIRSLPKETVISILDYFVGDHLFDCTDDNLIYATNVDDNICPRCVFLFLHRNKSEAAPFLFRKYMFGMHVDLLQESEEEDAE